MLGRPKGSRDQQPRRRPLKKTVPLASLDCSTAGAPPSSSHNDTPNIPIIDFLWYVACTEAAADDEAGRADVVDSDPFRADWVHW